MIDKVHIGQLIEKRRIEIGMTKSELGRRLGLEPQSVGAIIKKKYINTDQLLTIGEIMSYNFFEHYMPKQGGGSQDNQPKVLLKTPKRTMQISISIDDEDKQEKVLRVLGINLK